MVNRVRTLITELLVLAMLALSALPGSGALAAPGAAPCVGVAMASASQDSQAPCGDHGHDPAMACCHGGLCPASVLALAPSAPHRPAAPVTGAAYRVPESAPLSGIATLPGLHPPRTTA